MHNHSVLYMLYTGEGGGDVFVLLRGELHALDLDREGFLFKARPLQNATSCCLLLRMHQSLCLVPSHVIHVLSTYLNAMARCGDSAQQYLGETQCSQPCSCLGQGAMNWRAELYQGYAL